MAISIVRQNLLMSKGYTPYCGQNSRCSGNWPRTVWTDSQFKCPSCGWISKLPEDFIAIYKAKWGLQ